MPPLPRRTSLPWTVSGATRFAQVRRNVQYPEIKAILQHPEIFQAFLDATNVDRGWGRPRIPGMWMIVFIDFIASGRAHVAKWYETAWGIFRLAGFGDRRPCLATVEARFRELEMFDESVLDLIATLVRTASDRTDGHVGRDIHVDATEVQMNTRWLHDCDPGTCEHVHGLPMRVLSIRQTRQLRWDELDEEDVQDDGAQPTDLPDTVADGFDADVFIVEDGPDDLPDDTEQQAADAQTRPRDRWTRDDSRGYPRYFDGRHWCRASDPDARPRRHQGKDGQPDKLWVGGICHKAVDGYTRATLAMVITAADKQEPDVYPDLLDKVMRTTGRAPRAMTGDRGLAFDAVAKLNTQNNIATVLPLRLHTRCGEEAEFDQKGQPRCQSCQTRMRRVRYTPPGEHRGARVMFQCPNHETNAGCAGERAIRCETAPLHLLPIPTDHQTYVALHRAHFDKEVAHHLARQRFCVGSNALPHRTMAKGLQVLQFRANVAVLVEWLRVHIRMGWITIPTRNGNRRAVNLLNREQPCELPAPARVAREISEQRNTDRRRQAARRARQPDGPRQQTTFGNGGRRARRHATQRRRAARGLDQPPE